LYLPYSIEFQAKVTDRWQDLCPIFNISVEDKPREELLKEFMDKLKEFIHSIDAPTSIRELRKPDITKVDYMSKLDLLVSYAEDDAVSLTSYRAINAEIYKKIFKYAWEGKAIDF